MEQQDVAPTLVTLPGNVLHDIASHLDGHSLLALLRTCRDLHGSHPLRAFVKRARQLEGALWRLAALQAGLQVILQTLEGASAMNGQAEDVFQAVPGGGAWALCLCYGLRLSIWQQGQEQKMQAVADLQEAKEALQRETVAWPPGLPKRPFEQGLVCTVTRAMEQAEAELGKDEPPFGSHREMRRCAVPVWKAARHVVAGQLQARDFLLKAVMEGGRAQFAKQQAIETLQLAVQRAEEALRAGQGDVHVLQAAVHAAQAMLQVQGA